MLDFLELEETVGRAWHRLIGHVQTWPRHPEHAVHLAAMQPVLAICFRGFGGEGAVQIATVRGRTSGHRLGWRQRMGLGEEKLVQPARDGSSLMLPAVIDLFPDKALNRDLYVWLAAYMAVMPLDPIAETTDPLLRDLAALRRAEATAASVIASFPGLGRRYRHLAAATLAARHRGPLPSVEAQVEVRIASLLRKGAQEADDALPLIFPHRAPAGYLPMLPVPLWPDALLRQETAPRRGEDEPVIGGKDVAGAETERQVAVRENQEARKDERSPFILNRFEKILAMAEMVNVDRPSDDSDDDAKAAEDLDDMTLGERKGRPASRFRFDLDLPPEALDRTPLTAECTYPEWDFRTGTYLSDHCRVLAAPAAILGTVGEPDVETRRLIRRVRRQFEVLRPRREMLRTQLDGIDLDLDAVVRARCDLAAGGQGSDRIHLMSRPQAHDLAVTILVDVSLSTDAWFDNRRVLDVEKEALLILANGLAACGDNHAILTFTSRRRDWVRIETVKAFDEPMGVTVEARIAALKPGYYTRIGAAIRHAAAELARQPNRKRLLLVLTDGKPNDIDHYEGRFALEDSRRAVIEARRSGLGVFGVTVDREAKSYIPALFGQNGYAVVGNIAKLPAALPAVYRSLAG